MIGDIIDEVNTAIGTIDLSDKETYGIARIHNLAEEQYPAIYLNEAWNKIDIDNTVGLLTYHRVLSITEEDDDDSFDFRGSIDTTLKEVYNMILIIVMKKEYDYDTCIEIKNAIPNFITSADYSAVYINKGEIEANEDEIINEEFGETDYTRFKSGFNLFKLNYEIELINC
jgi:hypothetical protein